MRISDLYPAANSYLKATDLPKPVKVFIESAKVQTFTDAKNGESQRKVVLRFARASKQFVLNRTQARAVAAALGSEDIDDWPGKPVILSAAVAPNGQPTIQVSPVADSANGDNPFS